jgi:predicted Zn-ribbon and HTH transcriptional regulator
MDWYYAESGQQVGPVTSERLDQLRATGKITPVTLVWKEGMAEWQPYGNVFAAPPPGSAAAPALAVCAECGNSFKRDDMIPYQNSYVCATCKPMFLQRLREGAAPNISAGNLWRKGNQLVMPLGAELPARCAKCGQAVSTRPIRRKLYWHSQWIYLLILLNLLIYAVVALIVRKKAIVNVPVCPDHRKRRALIITISWVMVFLSIGMFALAASVNNTGGLFVLIGLVLLLTGIILGIVKGTLVRAMRIDERFVWVKGFGPAFLASLPEWTGPH